MRAETHPIVRLGVGLTSHSCPQVFARGVLRILEQNFERFCGERHLLELVRVCLFEVHRVGFRSDTIGRKKCPESVLAPKKKVAPKVFVRESTDCVWLWIVS